ncbi:helix-turn-helix transcriptional regulator [Clostridium sp. AM58-1XD]|uniref:helix-turn-helix domain-containing protein n=1 Tax=Clostridium sp. AM58-1XD TaxID=2292307 RepID=UPI000E4F9472|nr:helix-turn-helix transcriptional regulator [Clostridium sp. AM58-1XD]RGY95389.1 XRE family transcriptional regulator [Clostridium sp. AM58-1XD]
MGLDIIAQKKKELGLTNEELARLSGVPKGTIDKILSGVTKDPKLETLKAIAKVLGLSLDDFNDAPKKNEPSYDDIEKLVARNGRKLSADQKLRLIKLLSEIDIPGE